MDNLKIYEVYFHVKVYCGGIWRLVETSLKIPATSEREAHAKICNDTKLEIFSINNTKEIDISKL